MDHVCYSRIWIDDDVENLLRIPGGLENFVDFLNLEEGCF